MFQTGRHYQVHLLEPTEEGYIKITRYGMVTKIEGALIELDGFEVINTHSPIFAGSVDTDSEKEFREKAAVEMGARLDAWLEPDSTEL